MEVFKIVLVCILLIFVVLLFGIGILSENSKNDWFCKTFDLHKKPEEKNFDGVLNSGKCPRCGKKIFQRSGDNWY